MNRRQFISLSINLSSSAFLAGCARAGSIGGILETEEEFVMGAWNASDRKLEDVRVADHGRPEVWWFSQLRQRPRPQGADSPQPLRPGFGGDQRSGRIPDAVTVQWREMPSPGARPYTGELKGPFTILNVRSRIPPDILRLAREPRYVLYLQFSAGVEPVRFDWMLRRFTETGRGGPQEIAFGGDSFK
ncbi:MAG: hypothetical protein EYC67_05050 [Betaproteobacteria bacterium]|nr:MAG: hypothetical protein EYC67_05050 [Betaproteobacteria bacterium]